MRVIQGELKKEILSANQNSGLFIHGSLIQQASRHTHSATLAWLGLVPDPPSPGPGPGSWLQPEQGVAYLRRAHRDRGPPSVTKLTAALLALERVQRHAAPWASWLLLGGKVLATQRCFGWCVHESPGSRDSAGPATPGIGSSRSPGQAGLGPPRIRRARKAGTFAKEQQRQPSDPLFP